MIIYLGRLLPDASSNLPKAGGPRQRFCSVLLRMGFTYARSVTSAAVVSYTALPPLPYSGITGTGGIFLLHYPWSRLHRTLSGILPCEARTFLTVSLSSETARPFVQLSANYYIISYTSKQLPPINSLKRDVFGIASLGIFKKYSKNFNNLFAS